MKRNLTLLLAVCLLCAGTATAIDVPDGDFDTPALDDGAWEYLSNMGGAWFATGEAGSGTPWVGNNYSYEGYDYPGMGHTGAQWVDLNDDYIAQALPGVTYAEGVTYELSLWATTGADAQEVNLYFLDATNSDNGWNGATFLIDSGPIAVSTDGWNQYSVQYTATAEDAGKTIGIAAWGSSNAYADTVTLTPEPMTLALLGLGTLMIRRRKR